MKVKEMQILVKHMDPELELDVASDAEVNQVLPIDLVVLDRQANPRRYLIIPEHTR